MYTRTQLRPQLAPPLVSVPLLRAPQLALPLVSVPLVRAPQLSLSLVPVSLVYVPLVALEGLLLLQRPWRPLP